MIKCARPASNEHCSGMGTRLEYTLVSIIWFMDSHSIRNYDYMYRILPKIRPPPFLHTTLRQKWGRGVCSNIQLVSCIRHPSLAMLRVRSTIMTTVVKNGSFEHCGACGDDTKPRGIKATCIVSGDRGRPWVSSYYEQRKLWRWVCLRTQSTTELTQKLTTS